MIEQLKNSIISDYEKGVSIDTIIASVGSSSIKKSERKQFVYEVIYNYLLQTKKAL